MPARSRRSAMRTSWYAASSLTSLSSWRRSARSLRESKHALLVRRLDVDVARRHGLAVDLDDAPGLRERAAEAALAAREPARDEPRRSVLGLLDERGERVVPRLQREPRHLDLGAVLRGDPDRDVARDAALDLGAA